ncbi:unnamed protein product [Oikopleura dioica]|uniref:Small integral membrane protein 14 n=1 Tax=Oikopleura dioica TaxID=34765 RepID=E4WT95_OIKDI|nr:unnamed protein product [Oikopleura dioica]
MDMCECICTFQNAMRRLVEVLNRAQNYCSDDGAGDGHQNPAQAANSFLMMFLFMMFAAVMFRLRPNKNRDRDQIEKPSGGPGGSNNGPPPGGLST